MPNSAPVRKSASVKPRRSKQAAIAQPDAPHPEASEPTSTTNLATLAGRIPAELLQQLDQAIQTGHWLFAVWHVSNGKIAMQRTATDFPTVDLTPAVKLLEEDLEKLKLPA